MEYFLAWNSLSEVEIKGSPISDFIAEFKISNFCTLLLAKMLPLACFSVEVRNFTSI
jgi:hypothetical protein